MEEEKAKKLTRGGRNLALLGLISIIIAGATTGVSLAIYHNSGDIYLDRSRPGFLPDKEEIEQKEESGQSGVYDFSKVEKLTAESLTEYLDKLNNEIKTMNEYEKPFDTEILSDEHFGIPAE